MKKSAIPAIILLMLVVSSFVNLNDDTTDYQRYKELVDSNLSSLHDGVIEIDGNIFVVDTIPCASFASVNIFHKIMGEHYINCSTCTKMEGRQTGGTSSCVIVRKLNAKKPSR